MRNICSFLNLFIDILCLLIRCTFSILQQHSKKKQLKALLEIKNISEEKKTIVKIKLQAEKFGFLFEDIETDSFAKLWIQNG